MHRLLRLTLVFLLFPAMPAAAKSSSVPIECAVVGGAHIAFTTSGSTIATHLVTQIEKANSWLPRSATDPGTVSSDLLTLEKRWSDVQPFIARRDPRAEERLRTLIDAHSWYGRAVVARFNSSEERRREAETRFAALTDEMRVELAGWGECKDEGITAIPEASSCAVVAFRRVLEEFDSTMREFFEAHCMPAGLQLNDE